MNTLFSRRFSELEQQLANLEKTKQPHKEHHNAFTVDRHKLLAWTVNARHLISTVCGESSQHFQLFVEHEHGGLYSTNYENLLRQKAVFTAAKEDFEGGYLSTIRSLVQAEVFDDELEQAQELARKNFPGPAAVVAGVVLETALRELCSREGLSPGKLDRMNADLAKKGVYSKLVQKNVTALAGIRNAAAHGQSSEFSGGDVDSMIKEVRRFVAEHIT